MDAPRVELGRGAPERWRGAAAAAAGGALYFLGYLGWGLWPLLFVFLVPLWAALERARPAPLGRSLALGFVFGAVAYAGGFPWLWRLVPVFLAGNLVLGTVLWLLYGAWFALGFAVYAALYRAVRRRGRPLWLAGIAPLLVVEWLQPQVFAVHAGSGLVGAPEVLVQTADLGGPLLLSALVGAGNVAAFLTWRWWRRRGRVVDRRRRGRGGAAEAAPPVATWAAATAIGAAAVVYGVLRMADVEARERRAPTLRVGIVQANLDLLEKRRRGGVGHRRHVEQTRELLAGGPLDLVVWPETAYVRGLRGPLPISGRHVRADVAVPLLFGGTSVGEEGGRRVKRNSAFLVDADGTIRTAYDKNLLIPLAEFAPLAGVLPGLGAALPHVQEFRAADDLPPLRLGPWRLATPICYEVVQPGFVRRMVRATQPHLLVTLANDAWFGDSAEPWLHLALARLRAVEHRRALVRATNSGVSAFVDAQGRLVAQSGLFTRESLRADVPLLDGQTLYGRLGDWPGALAAAAVAGALALPRRRRTRGRSAPA